MSLAITYEDIVTASKNIGPAAHRTPLLEYQALNKHTGGRILIKAECLQRTGSFKFRGAYNRLSTLNKEERAAGVVAWSSGNHAQAVAAAAQLLNITSTIVMPSDAPNIKTENTLALGAEIVAYDRYREDREQIGRQLAEDRGAILVPSFDDPYIIAGQGTVGLELASELKARNLPLDTLLVCCGGGGLIAGTATAVKKHFPKSEIYSVEPEQFNDTQRSLQKGRRLNVDPQARSICDALLSPTPGALTFPINQRWLSGGLSVSDDEVRIAMRYAFKELKLVVEPGGAVALAAVLSGKIPTRNKATALVISGGNVDPDIYGDIICANA